MSYIHLATSVRFHFAAIPSLDSPYRGSMHILYKSLRILLYKMAALPQQGQSSVQFVCHSALCGRKMKKTTAMRWLEGRGSKWRLNHKGCHPFCEFPFDSSKLQIFFIPTRNGVCNRRGTEERGVLEAQRRLLMPRATGRTWNPVGERFGMIVVVHRFDNPSSFMSES